MNNAMSSSIPLSILQISSPERILAGLRTYVNFQMLYKRYAVFHF